MNRRDKNYLTDLPFFRFGFMQGTFEINFDKQDWEPGDTTWTWPNEWTNMTKEKRTLFQKIFVPKGNFSSFTSRIIRSTPEKRAFIWNLFDFGLGDS